MGFNVNEEIVAGYLKDIYPEEEEIGKMDSIDFEVFARIVAIV